MSYLSDKQLSRKNALILIDIQEKLIKAIYKRDSIIQNIRKLLKAYQILDSNILISEQNSQKLGKTIIELIPEGTFTKIEKMEFSVANNQVFIEEIKSKKITHLIICGIETHICIQQTVLELLSMGYKVLLISDAMGSRNKIDHEVALQRMMKDGAIVTTTESIIFELCKTSDRNEFKQISNIIKN